MASFGKKIISAFIEIGGAPPDPPAERETIRPPQPESQREGQAAQIRHPSNDGSRADDRGRADDRFAGHFDRLLGEANIPGPDYYEFSRMISVMHGVPDESARYNAAFAGLQAQGLSKQQLLDTAAAYLKVLATDAEQFQASVDSSYREKVRGKEAEAQEKAARIQSLSQEMIQLQQRIGALQEEIRAGKEKLAASSGGYSAESKRRQEEIRADIEKIDHYIH
ncbi:MAG TPA: hypothetical protein VMH27_22105 [Puia sp.]|nr:hypothetical protein [Puia sp.]